MCGITALLGNSNTLNLKEKRKYFLELSKKIRHRGPDWNGIYIDNKVAIAHERLSIVGVDNGSQPIINNDGYILCVNGEIYNYKELYKSVLHNKYIPMTHSDCEIIIYLYKEFGAESCVKMLDGVFSFILYDKVKDYIVISRDSIGVNPLYYGITDLGELMVSSEMKALNDDCKIIDTFPPGHLINIYIGEDSDFYKYGFLNVDMNSIINKYYYPMWDSDDYIISNNQEKQLMLNIKNSLTSAVKKRLMADVPFGVLLSGGLDSSLVASITNRLLKNKKTVWGNDLHTFSIGLKGAPDLKYARKVAGFLGTIHHEYTFTIQEGIDCLDELIYHLETYDVTTIRASTPMYLMSRKIKSTGIKMVLSGEGADEILGGYLYFHNAPNDKEFHKECVRRVKGLHNFDCLRANKSTMSWGLEARVPFLDKSFLELCIPIDPKLKLKNGKEKYILRKAFDSLNEDEKYLPDEILWRQKEQFSDGVGYNWIDKLKEHIENEITDNEFHDSLSNSLYETDKPKNKEELYYRRIFDKLFPDRYNIVPRWIPKMDWKGVGYDPSGRAQNVHNNTL